MVNVKRAKTQCVRVLIERGVSETLANEIAEQFPWRKDLSGMVTAFDREIGARLSAARLEKARSRFAEGLTRATYHYLPQIHLAEEAGTSAENFSRVVAGFNSVLLFAGAGGRRSILCDTGLLHLPYDVEAYAWLRGVTPNLEIEPMTDQVPAVLLRENKIEIQIALESLVARPRPDPTLPRGAEPSAMDVELASVVARGLECFMIAAILYLAGAVKYATPRAQLLRLVDRGPRPVEQVRVWCRHFEDLWQPKA